MVRQEAPQRSKRIACCLVGSEQGSQLPAHRDFEDWHTLGAFLVCSPIWGALPTPPLSWGCVARPCAPLPLCPPWSQDPGCVRNVGNHLCCVGLTPSAVLSS